MGWRANLLRWRKAELFIFAALRFYKEVYSRPHPLTPCLHRWKRRGTLVWRGMIGNEM